MYNKRINTCISLFILVIFIAAELISTPLISFAANPDIQGNTFYCDNKTNLQNRTLFTEDDIRNICRGLVALGYPAFSGINVEGIWAGGIDCNTARLDTIISAIIQIQKDLSNDCKKNNNTQNTILSAICNICYNPTDQNNKQSLANKTENIDTSPTREYAQVGQDASLAREDCDPLDCICKAATEDVSIWRPGSWIRGIIAAIALGSRKILSWVANAFIFAFIDLPQKLGGYIHFKPIYDPSTKTGIWKIMLAYANIGLVLGMIFMAIATIFRIEKYSWKKLLPKLLIVALLVNFSLVILGIFVDISNFLSMAFLSRFSSYPLGDTMAEVVTNASCSIYFQNEKSFIATMTAVFLAIVLSAIFLFQFAGLLFYVLTRIITIWVCAATSPLAFLGMAIDAEPINNIIKVWRDRFTQAIVSLPILAFALYLSLILLFEISTQISKLGQSGDTLSFIMLITYSAIIIALAQLLKFVAKSIGIEQVEKGFQIAKKAVTGIALAGAAAAGGFIATRAVSSATWGKISGTLQKSNSPVLYNIGQWMERQPSRKREKELKQVEADLKSKSDDQIRHFAQIAMQRGDLKKATLAANALIERGKPTEKEDDKLIKFVKDESTFNIAGLKKTNPALYAKYYSKKEEQLQALNEQINENPEVEKLTDQKGTAINNERIKRGLPILTKDELLEILIEDPELKPYISMHLALKLALKSTPEKLKSGQWQDILEQISLSINPKNANDFFLKLEENLTPDSFAAILQSMDTNKIKEHMQKLLQTLVDQKKAPDIDGAKQYLKNKGFDGIPYLKTLLDKI